MLSRAVVVSFVLIAATVAPATGTVIATSSCARSLETAGLCGSINGTTLTVSGTQQHSGSPVSPAAPGSLGEHTDTASHTSTGPAQPSQRALELAACMDDSGTTRCLDATGPREPAPSREGVEPGAPATPPIAITDLVRFAPPPVTASADPGNMGIADLPTNVIASAEVHVRTGELFGIPLTVRFSPTTYVYDYGDGSTTSTASAGLTWEQLGQAQFTPTPTSHVYRDRGTYAARADVVFSAEVDIGSGWVPVSGQITTPGIPQEIRILDARTALVAHTCIEDPRGAGC